MKTHRAGGPQGKTLVNPPRLVTKRDRRVVALVVPCPVCGVEVGEPCVTLTTGDPTGRHPARRRMAVRVDNEKLP